LFQRSKENLGKVFDKEEWQNSVELFQYNAAIRDYISWENRFEFVSLIEDFRNEKISGEKFTNKFDFFSNHLII
jgi:hypothetical protein